MSTLEIARVGRPHGLGGAVKVELHWPESDVLLSLEEVELVLASGERRKYRIQSAQRAGRGLLVKFAGVDDRNAAEGLRGARIHSSREAMPPLEEGEVYLIDLVGAEVHSPEGKVGEVVAVEVHPTANALVIRREDGSTVQQLLLPSQVREFDLARRRIELVSLEGLIE